MLPTMLQGPPSRRLLTLLLGLSGCAPRPAHDAQTANPLGPSFWVLPTPSEDDSLLGRILRSPPKEGFSLEEQSEPNPCGEFLADAAKWPMANRYENVLSERTEGDANGVFQLYGFSASFREASHLLYRVTTDARKNRLDTLPYQECCRERDCGWGYVSSLLRAKGEYVSARESETGLGAASQTFEIDGGRSFAVLERREVEGWFAAVLTAHERNQAVRACGSGEEWHGGECVSLDWVRTARRLCSGEAAADPFWKDDPQMQAQLEKQRAEACFWLDEHNLRQSR
jgi:hypothetical protein